MEILNTLKEKQWIEIPPHLPPSLTTFPFSFSFSLELMEDYILPHQRNFFLSLLKLQWHRALLATWQQEALEAFRWGNIKWGIYVSHHIATTQIDIHSLGQWDSSAGKGAGHWGWSHGVQCLEPTWWKEGTDSHESLSDLHILTIAQTHIHTNTYIHSYIYTNKHINMI